MLQRTAVAVAAIALIAAVAAGVPAGLTARAWGDEAVQLAEIHRRHEVAHPGWSFPGRVQTAPTPLSVAPKRLVAEAKARGYAEDCADTGPGEFCAKSGAVVPRDGATALEPVVLGWLIGPDGELREHLPIDVAPKHLVEAILAAEDRDFPVHVGVNFTATARALFANAAEGGYAQGASTLTMQVVRNLVQRREKTMSRKLREMVYAVAMDRHLGKAGILQMYLDAPYLGQRGSFSICGFRAAARHYFGKDATALSLAEAATLAAILPAPAKFAPDRYPERAKERRDRVLQAMADLYGYDVAEALATPIATVEPAPLPERFPAYMSATRAWLEAYISPEIVYGAGLVVTVGLDVAVQEEVDALFPAKLKWFESLTGKRPEGPLQSAAVLVDADTGLIRAVYGGTDVTPTSFNRATQARRQPGSSFKPLTYAMAFEQRAPDGKPRFTPASTQPNAPRTFKTPAGDWRPRNTGGEYTQTSCLAQGLAWSQNIATAGLLDEAGGPEALIAFAKKLGFNVDAFPVEMGLALGQGEVTPLEMAQFAATIANGGLRVSGTPVLYATDATGAVRVRPPVGGERVISPEASALTRELMRLVIDIGTGGAARGAAGEAGYGAPAMGKTGTTDQEKDLWFVGANPKLAAAVWIGRDVPSPLGAAASDLAAPLWGWLMNRATRFDAGDPPTFPTEPRLVRKGICTVTGKLAGASCRVIGAPFLPDTAPKQGCPIEHPPPEPEVAEDGTTKPAHESLWKRLAREQAERAAAAVAPAPAAP